MCSLKGKDILVSNYLINHNAMIGTWGSGDIAPLFLALDGGEWSLSRACCLTPEDAAPVPTEEEAEYAPEPRWAT
jgi:hypothetical protein